jgi:hypothetical protein
MNTRSQTRANREAAQKLIEHNLSNMKVKKTAAAENKPIATETPQKQAQTQVNAPTKKPRSEKYSDTPPKSTRYYTRSTGAIENKNLNVEFDEAFFDDASKAWNENKKKIGNGMYSYIVTRTRSAAAASKALTK